MRTESETSGKPRWSFRRLAVFVCAQLVLVLILLEIALRCGVGLSLELRRILFLPGTRTEYSKARTVRELLEMSPRGFTPAQRHGDFILNSKGFKTGEYSYSKADGVYRIVVLGDSFTFASGGVPYDSLWHVQTEKGLEAIDGGDYEVISLGVPAVGPDFYQRMWEIEGSRLDADLVVVAFFIGNDLSEASRKLLPPEDLDWLYQYSFVARLVRNLRLQASGAEELIESSTPEGDALRPGTGVSDGWRYDPEQPSMTSESFDRANRNTLWIFAESNRKALDSEVARATDRLLEIQQRVAASGVGFMVMLIPAEVQIDADLRRRVSSERRFENQDLDVGRPNRAIMQWCEEQGISCLDLLQPLIDGGQNSKLYRSANTHWNIEGNTLAAAQLADFVVRLKSD